MRTKTITIKIYRADELPDDLKEKALDRYRQAYAEYSAAEDSLASLKAFAEHFRATVSDYSIDWGNSSYSYAEFDTSQIEADIDADEEDEDTLAALIARLEGGESCPFTGFASDDDAIQGAVKAYRSGERDIDAILQAGFKSWLESAQSDYEGQMEEENIIEHCLANNIEFDETGRLVRE